MRPRVFNKIFSYNLVTSTISNKLLYEIAVRLLLLLAVFTMQLTIHPHARYITEAELSEYKKPRKDSYVPIWTIVILVIILPLVFLSIPWFVTSNFVDTSQGLLAWSLAIAINAFITETMKLIVGRPRPDFFYRCYPNGRGTKTLCCTGNWKDVIEGRKSFPSGHSSFSFCSLGFVSLWLCGRLGVLSRSRGKSLGVICCILPLVLASAVAMSRVCDNHHHWEDVIAGSVIGFFTTFMCYQQYYFPLDSELSGLALIIFDCESIDYSTQCCGTRDLNNYCYNLHLSNKNINLEQIKKDT